MTPPPLVTVVIPVHNCEGYLEEAIESVLGQTYRPVELIIVDDGSTDGSGAVARRFRTLRYCRQPHAGQSAARNRGVALAQGSYLAFLDADDVWVVDKLARQMAAFDADPNLSMVFGFVQQFRRSSEGAGLEDDPLGLPLAGPIAGTMLVRRGSFLRVGPFASGWRVGEFLDWYARALEAGLTSIMLPEVVLKRRVHGQNLGVRHRDSRHDYLHILKASLDRRRARADNEAGSRRAADDTGAGDKGDTAHGG